MKKQRRLALTLAALSSWTVAGKLQILVLDKEGKPVADAGVVVLPANKGVPNTAPPPISVSATPGKATMQLSVVPRRRRI